MGLIVGKEMVIKSIHPFKGPIVVELDKMEFTIGRGMFDKLKYEKI